MPCKKVSFIAAYTFPSLFSPSFGSAVSLLSCSDPVFHHVFTCYSAHFFPPPPQCLLVSQATLLPRKSPFSRLSMVWLACFPLYCNKTLTRGSKEHGSPCLHVRLALSLLGYCPDSASRNGLSWIFLSFLSM